MSVKIEGLQELLNELKQLPPKLEKKYLAAGMRAACMAVVRQARSNLKSNQSDEATGRLVKSMGYVVRNKRGRTIGVAGQKKQGEADRGPAQRHGHLVEKGHVMFAWGRATGKMVPPHPFLGPALRQKQQEIAQIMREKVVSRFIKDSAKRK